MCHPWGQRVPGFGSLSAPRSGPASLGSAGTSRFGVATLRHCRGGEECFLDRPPPCILGTHHEKGAQTFWSVVNRLPLSGNAVLCWKFCHVFHKLLRDGHSNVSATSSAQQLSRGQILSMVGCSGWWEMLAGRCPPGWGLAQGLLALTDPSPHCSAHKPPCATTPGAGGNGGASTWVQQPSARILLPRVRMRKLRRPGAGGSDTTGRLQGRECVKTSHSLPQFAGAKFSTPCSGAAVPALPAYFHCRSSRS